MAPNRKASAAELRSIITEELRAAPECRYVRVRDILLTEDGWTATFTGLFDNLDASTVTQAIMMRLVHKYELG